MAMISCQSTRVQGPSSTQKECESYQRLIAHHYSTRCNRTIEERERSPIIHLKKLHNWIKAVLIELYARKGDAVLDMACGKGGDIAKWHKAEAKLYVGVDIVESSLQQARTRHAQEVLNCSFPSEKSCTVSNGGFAAKFVRADCFDESMCVHVAAHVPNLVGSFFDIASCQFALHYAWSSMKRARAAFANITTFLKPGGYFIGTIPDSTTIIAKLRKSNNGEFGNRLYKVKFDKTQYVKALRWIKDPYGIQYEFHLEDAVDHCPEWLIPITELSNLAHQYGLELVLKKNFHDFVKEHMQGRDLGDLMHKLEAPGTISHDEWECASIYLVFAFRKRSSS